MSQAIVCLGFFLALLPRNALHNMHTRSLKLQPSSSSSAKGHTGKHEEHARKHEDLLALWVAFNVCLWTPFNNVDMILRAHWQHPCHPCLGAELWATLEGDSRWPHEHSKWHRAQKTDTLVDLLIPSSCHNCLSFPAVRPVSELVSERTYLQFELLNMTCLGIQHGTTNSRTLS